jgi:hypothetical protein
MTGMGELLSITIPVLFKAPMKNDIHSNNEKPAIKWRR